jgi:hypothetical protein
MVTGHKQTKPQGEHVHSNSSRAPQIEQFVNPPNLESKATTAEQRYSRHQIPSSQQPVYLMIAS